MWVKICNTLFGYPRIYLKNVIELQKNSVWKEIPSRCIPNMEQQRQSLHRVIHLILITQMIF